MGIKSSKQENMTANQRLRKGKMVTIIENSLLNKVISLTTEMLILACGLKGSFIINFYFFTAVSIVFMFCMSPILQIKLCNKTRLSLHN